MAEIIQDGSSGFTAKVDSNNRIHTQSLSVGASLQEALENNAYDISTAGLITLTDTSDSALLYVKNNEDVDIIVDTIFIDSTASDGTGSGTLSWHLNPTAGTLITDASDAQTLNRRIGSSVNIALNSYKATGNGKTFTGSDVISFPLPAAVGIPFGKPFIVPKGQAFGVSYQPPAGNTSMQIQVGVLALLDTTQTV